MFAMFMNHGPSLKHGVSVLNGMKWLTGPRAHVFEKAVVHIRIGTYDLATVLRQPSGPQALVLVPHASDRGRLGSGSCALAEELAERRIASLQVDLLNASEAGDPRAVFGIELQASRLATVLRWIGSEPRLASLPLGLMAAGTASGTVLATAARHAERVGAVVVRAGRPDLAEALIAQVAAPTLLIVGEEDPHGLELGLATLAQLHCPKRLRRISGTSHRFTEPGTMAHANAIAAEWFARHLLMAAPEAPALPVDRRRSLATADQRFQPAGS